MVILSKNVAVIGGGIVGATTAFYLKKKGHTVTLFDEGTGQATSAAAGIISPWLSQRRNQNWYQLARVGAKFYPTLMADLGESKDSQIYQQVGTLLFKKNQTLLNKLVTLAEKRRIDSPEIGEVHLLSSTQIENKIPLLSPTTSGLFVTGGARIDGQLLIQKIIQEFLLSGGLFRNQKVQSISFENNFWMITTNESTHHFDVVVLAVGAWLPSLLEQLGFQVDVRPQKGQLVELQTNLATNTWPVVMPQGEGDIIPFGGGKLLVGATHENEQGFDLQPATDKVAALLEEAQGIAPGISDFTQVTIRTGTRAYTSDFLPFFGTVGTYNNLYAASGLGSSGLTTGPAIGKQLADWINEESGVFNPADYQTKNYITKPVMTN